MQYMIFKTALCYYIENLDCHDGKCENFVKEFRVIPHFRGDRGNVLYMICECGFGGFLTSLSEEMKLMYLPSQPERLLSSHTFLTL